MHWCQDETLAAMSTVPVVGYLFRKLHRFYHQKTHHKCHEPGCEAEHLNHVHLAEEELLPNPPGRDILTVPEVDHYFGTVATILLMFDRKLLGVPYFPPASQFTFFLSQPDNLSARWKNKFFIWDRRGWVLDPEYAPKVPPRSDVGTDNRMICNVENTLELLHSIKRLSVEGGYLEAWFEDDEYGSSITSFIPGSFTREVLELLEDHILGLNGKGTGSSSQGLDQEQEADSGSTQSNQEASQEARKAGEAFSHEITGD